MVCTPAIAPVEIVANVNVTKFTVPGSAQPAFDVTFSVDSAHASSAPYINASGDLDLSCLTTPVTVKFVSTGTNVGFFYVSGDRPGLSFAEHPTGVRLPANAGHQFTKGPPIIGTNSLGLPTLTFTYHNDNLSGSQSGYAIYFQYTSGHTTYYLGEVDPIIDNGSNSQPL